MQPGPYAVYHYTTEEGKPLSTTLGVQAERIDAGHKTETRREQSSFLYHCYEGRGRTYITSPWSEEVVVKWEARDTFAVPAWSAVRHENTSTEGQKSYLVAVNDRPFLDALGLVRPERP